MSDREIKFRAWDAQRRQYFYSDAYGLEGFFARHAEEPLEQFTGLRDGNNNEIYEGDILCWSKELHRDDKTCWPVRWVERGWNHWSATHDKAVVIGNLRENAELLEAA